MNNSSTSPSGLSAEILHNVRTIADDFAIEGEFVGAEEISSGLINSTYKVSYQKPTGKQESYILQRINEKVFKRPHEVMRNIECVTRHINWKVLRVRKDSAGQTLNLYPARGGKCYTEGSNGGVWRCYNTIEGCRTYDVVENTRQAYQAAFAFGAFQDLVSDINPNDIVETIPDFHNTPKRFERLLELVELDPLRRLNSVQAEVDFVKKRASWISRLVDLAQQGVLPTRVTHNDTKINNVMMDEESDQAVCVIDLDTVMPGLSAYDFGDMVRTATSPAEEDEKDLSKVHMRMPMFEALVEGYMDAAHGFLTDAEIDQLAFCGKLISMEIGIRFLTDYLEGDVYFRTTRPEQNLDRCRTQFKLVESIEDQEPKMERFVRRVAANLR